MQTYRNITILGTSHISSQSIREINKVFKEINPDIICVELDKQRLDGLLSGAKPNYNPKIIRQIGITGYLFALIGGIVQKKLGSVVGIEPGADMLAAVTIARENKRMISLIDQNITITLRRLNVLFTFREKSRLFFDIFKSPFSKKIQIDLAKVPSKETIKQLLKILKDRYSGLHSALIEERNVYMTKRLIFMYKNHSEKKILAVVGAGHEDEMFEMLKKQINWIESQNETQNKITQTKPI